MFWWIVGSVVVLVLLYLAWAYNQLVSLNKRADGAWSDIDVQLKAPMGPGSGPGRDGQGLCAA